MNKLVLILIIVSISLAKNSEVSVFEAGNLESKNPYGLNSTEKNILKNKRTLGKIDSKIKNSKQVLESLNERLDGLESIFEGDSQKVNRLAIQTNKFVKEFEENKIATQANSDNILELRNMALEILKVQEATIISNEKNIKDLKKVIEQLLKSINSINSSYISEKEFKSNMKQFITKEEFNSLANKSLKVKKITKMKTVKKLSNNEKARMLNNAISLFKKDYFTKAIPMFETLIKLNYKRASSNFYLGDIWYYRKKYEKAIRYFKTSAILYDKADYMPKLMLHSAISFENMDDFSSAINFYSTLIDVYPNSQEAKQASINLSKIN